MKTTFARTSMRLARIASLVLLTAFGTIFFMRFAPGYFTDAREMDSRYSDAAQVSLQTQQAKEGNFVTLTRSLVSGWLHGYLGRSRQYDVPVSELIKPRMQVTAKLLLKGVGFGWLTACMVALPLSARRTNRGEALIAAPTALLLSIPIGAMATACVVADKGGAATVLAIVIAARDFKLVYRLLRKEGTAPGLLFARAQGISSFRIAYIYLLPAVSGRLLAMTMLSFVTALSAIVPLEVVFDVPGLGHLAWSAAMNRDLPVLLGVTLMMATAVGAVSMVARQGQRDCIV